MSANRLPPVLDPWESDTIITRALIWIGGLASQLQNRCQHAVANRHRNYILHVLESKKNAAPTGAAARQLDQIDAEIDRLEMERRA